MNGPELLTALMNAAGENGHGIATRLKTPSLQSYIWKFTKGKLKEPRRATMRPLAEHYGVPLEAFYDPALADQVAAARGLASGSAIKPASTPKTREPLSELAHALDVLVDALQKAGKDELIAVEGWLSAMAADPTNAKNKSALILKLLVTERDKSPIVPHDGARRSHIFEDLGVLDLGDANGQGDSAAASGKGKK